MRHDFLKSLRHLWRACLGSEGTYRPDLHYMRGPGPKWHAKYGNLAPKTTAAASQSVPHNRIGNYRG